ncbi:MAG: twin-arginine translocase subunit TatC [Spirochaetia bacterium]
MKREKQMTFWEHVDELRKRLIRIALVLAAAAGISLIFTPQILKLMLLPYGSQLKVISPTEGISNYLRIGLTCGAVITVPYFFLEIWAFIAPGLLPRERRYVYGLVPSAFVLFLAGAAFAWFALIPAAIRFLATFSLGIFKTEWTSQNYIPFVTALIFWIGVCFELPLVVFFLAKLRIVTPRLLLKGWRYAVVLICVIAAIITPTVDPFNMMLVAVPLIGLYFFSILLAVVAQGNRKKKDARSETA